MLHRLLAESAGHFWWPEGFKNVADPDPENLKQLQNPGHLSLTAPSIYNMYIQCIYYLYTIYILCIYYAYTMYILCIYYVYTMYILCIYYVYTMYRICIEYV